jgi:hypothetical protein
MANTRTSKSDTPNLTKVLCPQKPENLQPGGPDLPRSRRSSAEVKAEKERKRIVKEASAATTKVAKAKVNEL